MGCKKKQSIWEQQIVPHLLAYLSTSFAKLFSKFGESGPLHIRKEIHSKISENLLGCPIFYREEHFQAVFIIVSMSAFICAVRARGFVLDNFLMHIQQ